MFAALAATTPDGRCKNHQQAKGDPFLGAYHFLYNVVSHKGSIVRQGSGPIDCDLDAQGKPSQESRPGRDLPPAHPLLLYAPAWYWHIQNPPAHRTSACWWRATTYPLTSTRRAGIKWSRRRHSNGWERVVEWWKKATILPTSHGKVNGYRRRIDVNACGTTAELAALAGPGGAFIPPGRRAGRREGRHSARGRARPRPSSGPSDSGDETPRVPQSGPRRHLFDIAIRFWEAEDGRPAYRVMLRAFDENKAISRTSEADPSRRQGAGQVTTTGEAI